MRPRKSEPDDLQKAQRALARAEARAIEEFWSQSAKRKVEDCRRAVTRCRKKLEQVGQYALPLEIEEVPHTPGAFH